MSTTPTTPPAICLKCGREMRYNVPRMGAAGGFIHADTGSLECAPPLSPPTDEAKLREVIEKALRKSENQFDNIEERTDRILAALAPHLAQRDSGDSELLDWLETTRRALFTRDSSGVVKFDAETSATDWHCVNAPTFRQAIKSAQRGEGKP